MHDYTIKTKLISIHHKQFSLQNIEDHWCMSLLQNQSFKNRLKTIKKRHQIIHKGYKIPNIAQIHQGSQSHSEITRKVFPKFLQHGENRFLTFFTSCSR